MNVPNHEKKAFRDMTPEERSAIVEAHAAENAEILISESWVEADNEVILPKYAYRTRPRQLVIPWEHIKPEYKWAAMDAVGGLYIYTHKPEQDSDDYIPCVGCMAANIGSLNIDTTGIDWRESLTARPEGV